MLQAVMLAGLGVDELDANSQNFVQAYDPMLDLGWFALVDAPPGEAVVGNLVRCDPGTMGRTLFHFRAEPRDGRHRLAYPCHGEGLASEVLPPLPALCAFFGAVRAALVAGQVPDLAALVPLHLGVAFTLPAVELRPGDQEIRIQFSVRDRGQDRLGSA